MQKEEAIRFVLAGTSCTCAVAVTHPIDVIKIRMQPENEMSEQRGLTHLKNRYYDGWLKGCGTVVKDEGVRGLYKGSIRLGAYEPLKRLFGATDPANTPLWKKICAGAISVTNPIDVIKIRMQLENEMSEQKGLTHLKNRYYNGWLKGCGTVVKDEGVRGLYKGLLPSLMREGSYSTIRLGAYEPLKRFFGATDPAHTPLWKKICAGAISGAVGSSIATPTDLVKVRMQAQGKLKEGEEKRYKNTFSAFREIFREGGIKALYVGVGPTVKRAAILTATQIPAYDHIKHLFLNHGVLDEGIPLHVTASMLAGFCTAVTTSPVDVVKTRMMNQCRITKPYSSAFDCFFKTFKREGPLGLYKGFIPNWMRIGPHTIVTFFVFEQLRRVVGMAPV